MDQPVSTGSYRGRLAPSPTGYLHLGHARTFWIAQQRAQRHHGRLVLRNDDLDAARCRNEFVQAMLQDLQWFGLQWHEGPDKSGPHGPYHQSQRFSDYRTAFSQLYRTGHLYPCTCSRREIREALSAPHAGEEEPIYPGLCRPQPGRTTATAPIDCAFPPSRRRESPRINWRFQVPDSHRVRFLDGYYGPQEHVAGRDFGDFIVWRHDGIPSYQLAAVVDDHTMAITEVVRGADLLLSTARQILLYQALGWTPPAFFHCPLLTDNQGLRLAKRHDALSLRRLRERGSDPEQLRAPWPPIL